MKTYSDQIENMLALYNTNPPAKMCAVNDDFHLPQGIVFLGMSIETQSLSDLGMMLPS